MTSGEISRSLVGCFQFPKDTASNRLNEIREDLTRHPELRKFIDDKRGGKFELRLTNGAWIAGTGMGGPAMRGEHPACIALDDVLTDMGDTPMDSVKDWLKKVVTPMLFQDKPVLRRNSYVSS